MISFTRTLALGVACSALMIAPHARAAESEAQSPQFHPSKAWEVGSIKAVTDYSGECIIQTEFNNGFLLQINGSSNWVQQLNLNIRQTAFEIGKSYDVSMSVPGQASEIIKGIANRANIVSVPLKGKKELYKAMRDNGVLDIKIEGNEFRFFLTGFNLAAGKFERCMAGGAPGVVASKDVRAPQKADGGLGGIVAAPALSVSSEDLSDSEKEFLVNESIAFEQQEVAMKDAEIVVPVAVEKTETQAGTAFEEEDAVAALNAIAAEAIHQGARPRQPVAAAEIAPLSPADESTLIEADIAVVEEEIVALPEADPFTPLPVEETVALESEVIVVEMVEPAAEEIIVEVEDVAVVTTMPIMPQSDVDAAQEFLDEPERSIDMTRAKIDKKTIKADADMRRSDIETADSTALAKIVALEKALEAARAENDALNDELKVSLEESKQEVMTVQSENWNLERATMRFNEAERQMKKLGQQLQKERAQHAMEKKELETMLFDPEVTSQEQLARLSTLERELAQKEAELNAARAALKIAK